MNNEIKKDSEISLVDVAKMIVDGQYDNFVETQPIEDVEQAKRHKAALLLDKWHARKKVEEFFKKSVNSNEVSFRRNISSQPENIQKLLMMMYRGENERDWESFLFHIVCSQALKESSND